MNPIFLTVAVLVGIAGISAVLARCPMRYWVYGLLLCIPFDVGAPLGFIPRLSVVDYLSAAGLIAFFSRFTLKESLKKVIGAMGMPLVISWGLFLVYGSIMAVALHGSFKGVLRWGEFLFVYVVAVLAAEDDLSARVASILSALGSLMALWALAQFCHSHYHYEQAYAIFDQHNGLGAFLSLCLPASWALLYWRKSSPIQAGWTVAALLISTAFLVSYSRGAWLGLIGALIIVSALRRVGPKSSSFSVGLGLVLIVVGAFGPISWIIYRESKGLPIIAKYLIPERSLHEKEDSRLLNTSQRTLYWKAAADVFRAHPWVGLGPKNYDQSIYNYLSGMGRILYDFDFTTKRRVDFWMHLHNMYLQILAEYGSIGLLLWAFAMALLCAPLFQPAAKPPDVFQMAFRISGIAFLLHNTVDILFVNSFDLVFIVFVVLCQKPHARRLYEN